MREIASIRNTSSSARNQANTPKEKDTPAKKTRLGTKKKRLDRSYDDQDPRDRAITRGINRPTQLRSDWSAGKEGVGESPGV